MALERLLAKVREAPTGCWEWQAARSAGYGKFFFRGEVMLAHRVSFELHKGPVPEGMIVRHRCDNPSCIRPEHLELGTLSDNSRDCRDRGRMRPNGRATKLDKARAEEIRARYKQGGVTQATLARDYGVSQGMISEVILRRKWA